MHSTSLLIKSFTWVSQLPNTERTKFPEPKPHQPLVTPPLPGKSRSNAHLHVWSDLSVLEQMLQDTWYPPTRGPGPPQAQKLDNAGVSKPLGTKPTVSRA